VASTASDRGPAADGADHQCRVLANRAGRAVRSQHTGTCPGGIERSGRQPSINPRDSRVPDDRACHTLTYVNSPGYADAEQHAGTYIYGYFDTDAPPRAYSHRPGDTHASAASHVFIYPSPLANANSRSANTGRRATQSARAHSHVPSHRQGAKGG
jgi:hypothetical protein